MPDPRISRSLLALACLTALAPSAASPPDHIVIVIEENHSFSQVVGNPDAPFINSLTAGGASFTNFYAITHPSQPNYVHMFSGASQGVTNNTVPAAGTPFDTPNFGAALVNAGRTFIGYSEDLPEPGSTVGQIAGYYRKHNPWVDWQVDAPMAGGNQLPPSVNLPFTMFPADYTTLPDVAIVVPNIVNDMHDGTIAQGDAWLQTNLGPYAEWIWTNNSLLIVTFDEDESASRNRIPTIIYGPGVRVGTVATTWTAHNLLRTIGDIYGATPPGAAAIVRPIVGAFNADPPVVTRAFQRSSNGPSAVISDTYIEPANPALSHAASTLLVVDGSPQSQGLVQFESAFGPAPDQVPVGSTILSAKLSIMTGPTSGDSSVNTVSVFRMLIEWSESTTWNSMVAGVSTDDMEAASTPEFTLDPNVLYAWAIFDVTATVQTWAANPASNHGWLLQPGGNDGWRCGSSDNAALTTRPTLEITYLQPPPPPCLGDANQDHTVNFADITSILGAWGGPGPTGDADHNGIVDFSDTTAVLSQWNNTCP